MILKIAWRNIWRNNKRTLISTLSISGALILVILMRSMQLGFYDSIINTVVQSYSGYTQVHANGYWEKQSVNNSMEADEILIDEIPIKDINLKSLRSQVGYVPQDTFLFSDTIMNNIKFGLKNATDDDVVVACKTAKIHKEILSFEKGYKTILGERGVNLSGGQKQRISIARALIKQPKILILDDCLSAMDTETEKSILQSLNTYTKNITTIIISHRISSIKDTNNIIVLKNGQIIQEGNHEQLITQKGYYKELYNKQIIEKESIE